MSEYGCNNKFAQDHQRRPPAGWKVENWFFQKILMDAKRTQYQPLIQRIEQMKDASRHELVLIANRIARSAKGLENPEEIDIDAILIDN